MDPIAAVLCGVAATLVGSGHGFALGSSLLLAAGFYGVARASGSRAAPWLIGAVGLAYLLARVTDVVAVPYTFSLDHPTLVAAPKWIASLVHEGTCMAAVVIARRRIGTGLFVLTICAASIALVFGALSSAVEPEPGRDTLVSALVKEIDFGWSAHRAALETLAFLVTGLGAPAVGATPRRVSAVMGAIAASLLAATLESFPRTTTDGDVVFSIATATVAWIAMTVAIGRLRGIGGGGAAIAGMVLAILQVLAMGLVTIGMDEMHDAMSTAFTMGLGLGFLGLGIAVFVPSALPLPRVRYLVGGALLLASAGSTIALIRHVAKVRANPYWGVKVFGEPAGVIGFSLLAAYFAFLAAPPEAPAAAVPGTAPDQRGLS